MKFSKRWIIRGQRCAVHWTRPQRAPLNDPLEGTICRGRGIGRQDDVMEPEAVDPAVETLNAYDRHATQYVDRTSNARSPLVDDLIGLTSAGARVLELGTGPGRDAVAL